MQNANTFGRIKKRARLRSNLSDFQFLWIDLFLITTLAVVFGFTKAYNGPLASKPPKSSLIALQPIFSLISQLVIVILFQVAAFIFVINLFVLIFDLLFAIFTYNI